LRLSDGAVVLVDDAWEDAQGIWYRRGGVTNLLERERVKAIERGSHENQAEANTGTDVAKATPASKMAETSVESVASARPIWIYLVGGARFEVDEVTENPNGAWYRRGTLSIFLERARIERIEREPLEPADASLASSLRARGWTTGNASIDGFIRQSGARYGVDPYLIFCVMEQESHFHTRALSPKGAQGLMQLMPGTAARYGVRRPFDPAQNIMGGARYLKELLQQFHGRVDLVLASYNAGEGAVIKFGHNVPPYRETRDYVKRISKRYGQSKHPVEKMTAKAGVEPAARLR
jgi:soluble lytic murein transglycosylase-like protein